MSRFTWKDGFTGLAFSADERVLFAAGDEGEAIIFDSVTGDPAASFAVPKGIGRSAVSSNGSLFAVAKDDTDIHKGTRQAATLLRNAANRNNICRRRRTVGF